MSNKMALNTYLSTVTLSANALNTPIKGHMVTDLLAKQVPYICCDKKLT